MYIRYSKLLTISYVKNKKNLVFCGPLGSITYKAPENTKIHFFVFENLNYIYLDKSTNIKIISDFKNICQGLLFGFTKNLFLKGIGFRFTLINESIVACKIGFSHLVYYYLNSSIYPMSDNPTNLFLYSFNYSLLNDTAKDLSSLKKVDKYKGQGIYIL